MLARSPNACAHGTLGSSSDERERISRGGWVGGRVRDGVEGEQRASEDCAVCSSRSRGFDGDAVQIVGHFEVIVPLSTCYTCR